MAAGKVVGAADTVAVAAGGAVVGEATAEEVLGRERAIHVIVNNAGLAGTRGQTPDGFELAFGVNHLGPYLLTRLLLPTLERAAREGTRMGLWGASQAIAMGAGGFLGTVLVDGASFALGERGAAAYVIVFALEAVGFFVAQALAQRMRLPRAESAGPTFHPALADAE